MENGNGSVHHHPKEKIDGKVPSFNWTDSQVMCLMKVLKEFHDKFGYKQHYDWTVVNRGFQIMTGVDLTKHGKYVARNKVEHMKKLWKTWCDLRFKVTGAGWDQKTGMVTLEDSVWDSFKKTQQKKYLHFRTRGVDPELCELWDDVFGSTTANGANVISPSMQKEAAVNKRAAVHDLSDDDIEEDGDASDFEALMDMQLMDDSKSMKELMSKVRADASLEECLESIHETMTTPVSGETGTGKMTNDSKTNKGKQKGLTLRERLKRKRKSAATSFNEHMQIVGDTGKKILSLLEGECDSTVAGPGLEKFYTFERCFEVVERLVGLKLIEECSKFWCFTVSKLGDEFSRRAFMTFPKDEMRLAWLEYEFDKEKKNE